MSVNLKNFEHYLAGVFLREKLPYIIRVEPTEDGSDLNVEICNRNYKVLKKLTFGRKKSYQKRFLQTLRDISPWSQDKQQEFGEFGLYSHRPINSPEDFKIYINRLNRVGRYINTEVQDWLFKEVDHVYTA